MKLQPLIIFVLLLFTVSCNNSSVYNESHDFENNQWKKNDPKTFEFTLDQDNQAYDIVFKLSHVYGYQFESVPLTFRWIQPDGTVKEIPVDFRMKDKSGQELGDCSGDICDLSYQLSGNVVLPKGKHQIVAAHSFQFDYLPNIIHIALDVSKAKS